MFQEDLDRVKGQEYLDYFSLIDFAVDGYAYRSASHAFPDTPALQNRTVNGSLLM